MTNLKNVLETMETETTGVKNDVTNYLLEYSDNDEDLQAHIEDLTNYGCESGQVNHLIYYSDTVEYFEENENEIMEMLEQFGIEEFEGSEFIDALSQNFNRLDDFETRMNDDEIHFKAMEIVADDESITVEELENNYDDYESYIFDERYNLATELNNQDKNYLAWAIFEQNAHELYNELDEMGLIKVM